MRKLVYLAAFLLLANLAYSKSLYIDDGGNGNCCCGGYNPRPKPKPIGSQLGNNPPTHFIPGLTFIGGLCYLPGFEPGGIYDMNRNGPMFPICK